MIPSTCTTRIGHTLVVAHMAIVTTKDGFARSTKQKEYSTGLQIKGPKLG
jgi:hypothetical protein